MSIMSFLNTVYDTAQHSQRFGTPKNIIGGITGNEKQYDYNSLRYPLDIGSADKGHYMVIHINTQTKTQFDPSGFSTENPTIVDNMKRLSYLRGASSNGAATQRVLQVGSQAVSSVTQGISSGASAVLSSQYASQLGVNTVVQSGKNVTQYVVNNVPGLSSATQAVGAGVDTLSEASKNINSNQTLRTIRRTTDSIVLYMPDTLNFQYSQTYDELTLGPNGGGLAAAGASIFDAFTSSATRGGQITAPFVASSILGNFGDYGRALSAGALGMVQNPMLELIYSQPSFRNFQFDFMFYPRDEKEALEVQKILEKLRFHQAPEVKDSTYGYFLVPPSEFDIKFYYNGRINDNIDQISTCVLENIIVNYSPSGFSAYESQGENTPQLGRTGMPVAIQLTLMFKETQILTKESYLSKTERETIDTIIKAQENTPAQIASDEFFLDSFEG